jgi:protein SCO1/2
MLGTLADRASDVDADLGEDYSVIVISIDPTDNPRTLDAAYREHVLGHDLPLNTDGRVVGWHMLTGTRPAIDAVAEAIGFRYGYDSEIQEYAHPTVTTLIEPSGRVNRYLEGLGFSGQTLHRSLIEASQGTLGTPLDAIIATCFVYDPARGNYVLFAKGAMKVGGAAIVGLVAVAVGGLLVREWRGRRAA